MGRRFLCVLLLTDFFCRLVSSFVWLDGIYFHWLHFYLWDLLREFWSLSLYGATILHGRFFAFFFFFDAGLGVILFVVVARAIFLFFVFLRLFLCVRFCRYNVCAFAPTWFVVFYEFLQNNYRNFLQLLRTRHLQYRQQRVFLLLHVRVFYSQFLLRRYLFLEDYFERGQHAGTSECIVKIFYLCR